MAHGLLWIGRMVTDGGGASAAWIGRIGLAAPATGTVPGPCDADASLDGASAFNYNMHIYNK